MYAGLVRSARYVVLWIVAAAITAIAAVVAGETLLRLGGERPWRCNPSKQTIVHEADQELGWRSRSGRHLLTPYAVGASSAHMTVLPDGARTTGRAPAGADSEIVLVGCSFLQGWGISDWETCPWRMQRKLPHTRVANYGTSGYGTYQSLLVLERLPSARPSASRRIVLYGFIEEHEDRNIAHALWMMLQAESSTNGSVAMPYCTLDARGTLVRHSPESYPQWPLRGWLATVALLQRAYAVFEGRIRATQARPVTEQLLLEMQRSTVRAGVEFAVVLLHFRAEAKDHYTRFLRDHGIDTIDCDFPLTRSMVIPGDVHPNGAMHAHWAACILRALAERGFVRARE